MCVCVCVWVHDPERNAFEWKFRPNSILKITIIYGSSTFMLHRKVYHLQQLPQLTPIDAQQQQQLFATINSCIKRVALT